MNKTQLYSTELSILANGLTIRGIPFTFKSLYDGFQVEVKDNKGEILWDAICHSGSYGHESGLLEVMGEVNRNPNDDVEGWLTAQAILNRLDGIEDDYDPDEDDHYNCFKESLEFMGQWW